MDHPGDRGRGRARRGAGVAAPSPTRAGPAAALLALLTTLAPAAAQEHIRTIHVLEGQPGERLGSSVGGLGDVDGDGHDDFFVVSAWAATIRSGRDASILHAYHLESYAGVSASIAVAGLGDLDGDGRADYAVGSPASDVLCTDCGLVTVYSGDGSVLLSIPGETDDRAFGAALAPAGDVDGDGVPDLLIGAPDRSYGVSPLGGRIRVHSGADGSLLRDLGCQGCTTSTSPYAYDNLGERLANAGDVDGDGVDDVIATYVDATFGYPPYGGTTYREGARVFSGRDGSLLHDESARVNSNQSQFERDLAPREVAGLGDLDGDGHAEVALANALDAVRIRSGGTGSQLFVLTWTGTFGGTVAAVGDTDCDGVDDILVSGGAPAAARLYSGRTFRLLATLPMASSWSGLHGILVGRAGDVDGDGRPDFIVGDPGHGDPAAYAGKVTVCSLGTGSAVSYGSGCPGTGGLSPVLAVEGCHFVQGSFAVSVSRALGGSLAWVLPSLSPGRASLGGCELLVDLRLAGPGVALALDGTGPGRGSGTLSGVVPAGIPVGVPLYLQAFVLDDAAPAGWVASNGIAWTLDRLPGTGLPRTWWVDAGATGAGTGADHDAFATIQAALDAADHGDTVLVRDGHYKGPGNRELRFGGKRLTLRSTGGPLACIVDAEQVPGAAVFVFDRGETKDSELWGFTVTGGRSAGIVIGHSGPTIRHCLVRGNTASLGGGLLIHGGNPTLENCEIRDNAALGGWGGGLYCAGAAATIRNCTIRNNGVPGVVYGPNSAGIAFDLDHGTVVSNSIVWSPVAVRFGNLPVFRYCAVFGAVPGDGEGNSSGYPFFVQPDTGGFSHLAPWSPCIDAGDPAYVAAPGETDIDGEPRVAGGRVDIGADEVP